MNYRKSTELVLIDASLDNSGACPRVLSKCRYREHLYCQLIWKTNQNVIHDKYFEIPKLHALMTIEMVTKSRHCT